MEMIVVIAVISVLAAIITPNAFMAIEKSKVSKAASDFRTIKAASTALYADTGYWPRGGNSSVQVRNSVLMVNTYNWEGWHGPYLDNFRGATPWNGTYYFTTNAQLGRTAAYELSIELEDYCFPSGPNGGCPIPRSAALRIDRVVDDDNVTTGDFRWGSDTYWVMVWDFCPTSSCW